LNLVQSFLEAFIKLLILKNQAQPHVFSSFDRVLVDAVCLKVKFMIGDRL